MSSSTDKRDRVYRWKNFEDVQALNYFLLALSLATRPPFFSEIFRQNASRIKGGAIRTRILRA